MLKDGPEGTTWEVKRVTRERLFIFDTTLRDGAQTQGVDFSVEDKRQIALALDGLGIDYIEGGWPGANPTDTAFFAERPPLKHARFTAFGMTKRSGRSAANDPALAQVLDADADAVCLVGKTWDYQVDVALEIPLDGECRQYRPLHRGGGGEEARAAVRRRAFLRRLQGQSRLCAGLHPRGA